MFRRMCVLLTTLPALLVGPGLGAVAIPVAATDHHAARSRSGPPLTVGHAELAAATHCDRGARSGRRTVLLVHGTGATSAEAWAWNYENALPAAGFGYCTVELPDRALGNAGRAAQFVVFAARQAYRVSGRDIALLGHSQGGLLVNWAAKFWPDVARHATDVIGLAADVRGTALADTLCAAGTCAPIAWQMRTSADFTRAATRAPLPRTTSFTSIATAQDEVVYPQPRVSSFSGVRAVLLQQVCPGHIADHGLLLADAVAYALVMDALTHPGPARPSRVPASVCTQAAMPGTDPVEATGFAATVVALALGLADLTNFTGHERPVPRYARRYVD